MNWLWICLESAIVYHTVQINTTLVNGFGGGIGEGIITGSPGSSNTSSIWSLLAMVARLNGVSE
jgi:hypothetical protein